MKILVSTNGDAASYYRVACPFGVLNYRTDIEAAVIPMHRVPLGSVKDFDALWLQMNASSFDEVIAREFKDAGKPVIYDVDDWMFDIPPSWNSYDEYFERGTGNAKNRLGFHQRLLQMADVITTTTPYLAGLLRDGLSEGKAALMPQIRILPNAIMQGDWDTIVPQKTQLDGPILGWFGAGNHWEDFYEIAPAIDYALHQCGGYLVILGMPEVVSCLPDRLRKRTYIEPIVPINKMRSVREKITSFDAGLAWATNRLESAKCRSPLKALQYGAAGVPVFASANVYNELIHEEGDIFNVSLFPSLLKDKLNAWRSGFADAENKKRAARFREIVFEKYTYERNAMRWLEVLEEVVG